KYFLDLEWTGEALTDITINQSDYGGLFLRMPWQESTKGEIINAARQKNSQTAGQRAMWIDVGMEIGGLDEWGHIALFDHRDNPGYHQPCRVDNQFGIGSQVPAQGDRQIQSAVDSLYRYQMVEDTGLLTGIAVD